MAKKEASKEMVVVQQTPSALATWTGGDTFDALSGLANKFSQSKWVPEMFQGKPHECFIAMQMALRMNEDPFLVLQNITMPKGKPALSAPFAIERCNRLGPFSEDLDFEVEGDGESLKVTCFAPLKRNGKVVKATVSMAMAKAEGWTRNTKYQTMPEQMLCYRAAIFLIRRHCPAILHGIPTADEVDDISASRLPAAERPVTGSVNAEPMDSASKVKDLNSQIQETI